jgi:hypothetical protein
MSILADKSYLFAIRIVKLNEYLTKEKKEYTMKNYSLFTIHYSLSSWGETR